MAQKPVLDLDATGAGPGGDTDRARDPLSSPRGRLVDRSTHDGGEGASSLRLDDDGSVLARRNTLLIEPLQQRVGGGELPGGGADGGVQRVGKSGAVPMRLIDPSELFSPTCQRSAGSVGVGGEPSASAPDGGFVRGRRPEGGASHAPRPRPRSPESPPRGGVAGGAASGAVCGVVDTSGSDAAPKAAAQHETQAAREYRARSAAERALSPPIAARGATSGPEDSVSSSSSISSSGGAPSTGSSVATSVPTRALSPNGRMGSSSPERSSVPLSAVLVTDDSMGGVVSRIVVQRTAEMKLRRPERIELERRQLVVVPQLPGERQLRSLNLQHNAITTLHNAGALSGAAAQRGSSGGSGGAGPFAALQGAAQIGAQCPHIVFLDLYNNQITTIGNGLELLHELQVLILGKNRLRSVEGLHLPPLRSLDVLDLRSNHLTSAPSNGYPLFPTLAHMTKLRTLNLAGNQVRCVVVARRSLVCAPSLSLHTPWSPHPPHLCTPHPRIHSARAHARHLIASRADGTQLLAQLAGRALIRAKCTHWA